MPWNNGGEPAAGPIRELNAAIGRIGEQEGVPVFAWYDALRDPADPAAMRAELTIDGDHPSVAGYRKLAALVDVGLG